MKGLELSRGRAGSELRALDFKLLNTVPVHLPAFQLAFRVEAFT